MNRKAHEQDSDTWLVAVLGEQLALAVSEQEPSERIQVDGVWYATADPSAVTAFYDRLLDASGAMVGVRVCPTTTEGSTILHQLPRRAYLRVAEDVPCFDIHLFPERAATATSAGDQAFGGRFYRAQDGTIALSLDLGYLTTSPDEREAVLAAPVKAARIS